MTKKTKILSGLILSTVLATSAFAACDMKNKDGMMNKHSQSHYMKRGSHHGKKDFSHMRGIMKKLNLSDTQKEEMKKIVKEARKNKETINDAFSKTSFDKEKFIKIMNEKRENMIKSKADVMEKMYAVLDTKQKEQFKTLLELKTEKMMSRYK